MRSFSVRLSNRSIRDPDSHAPAAGLSVLTVNRAVTILPPVILDSHMHVGEFPLFNVRLDPEGLVTLMRDHGIATGLVFHPDNALVRRSLVSRPGVYGLVWANPRMPDAVEETQRLLDEPGSRFRGVKLHPLL